MEKPEQWKRIKEIVGIALERDPGERESFLDQACADNAELREEVESLLSAHADAGGLSESPWAATTLADATGVAKILGPYRLIQVLGVGGMGQVWLAEQTEPVHRPVALKLVRAGIYDAALVKRFLSERQSLAIMDHPSIAKVFDASATAEGQPYFAMEYVNGPPIIDYCDRKKLDIRERLKLFIQVCGGVQHAHQKAIIHRDLKPSNILVTEVDGKPVPRIIDFGLAKAVAPVPGETLFTHVGVFLGTPGYMSPEQADPELHDVDTRTDVYSLGVVLYELLTGFLPFDTTQWKKQRLDEVLRQLRETDPERPSTKVSSGRATSTERAEARGTEPGRLVSLLRGDLDWITLTALEKDRNRRYDTPSALASDLENYLANRPVQARPASTGYRLRKYVRRNRIAVAVASGAAVLLIAFAVMQSVELRRIIRERDRADRITEFMTSMFKVSDPSEARGNTITAREILDKSSKEIGTKMANEPELQAQMMFVMGDVYRSLGLYPRAHALLTQAAEAQNRVLGSGDPQTLRTQDVLAWTLNGQGHSSEAEKIERETLTLRRRVLGLEHRDTIRSMMHLAAILGDESKYGEAEELEREAVQISRRVRGPEHPDTLLAMNNLASTLFEQSKYDEVEKLFREALEVRTRVLGPEHPDTLMSMNNLARTLEAEGNNSEAEKLLRPLIDIERRVLGPDHPDTLRSIHNLGASLQHEGRYAEAEKLQSEVVEAMRRVRGPEQRETLGAMDELGITVYRQGRYTKAEKLQRELVDVMRRTLGREHMDTLEATDNLITTLVIEGRNTEAQQLERASSEIRRRVLGPDHPLTAAASYNYACANAIAGKREKALLLLRESIDHGLPLVDALAMAQDRDLKGLHGDPRFEALVAEVQKRAVATAQKTN